MASKHPLNLREKKILQTTAEALLLCSQTEITQ